MDYLFVEPIWIDWCHKALFSNEGNSRRDSHAIKMKTTIENQMEIYFQKYLKV